MRLDDVREMRTQGAALAAAGLAAAAVRVVLGDSAAKPLIAYAGKGRIGQDKLDLMADFVRQNVTAPAEALFRHSGARGVHAGLEAGYLAADLADRAGFETFRMMLLHLDAALEAEEARLTAEARLAEAAEKGPIPAAALSIDQEDTILEKLGDPLAVHKDRVLAEVKNDEGAAQTGATEAEAGSPAPQSDAGPVPGAAGAAGTAAGAATETPTVDQGGHIEADAVAGDAGSAGGGAVQAAPAAPAPDVAGDVPAAPGSLAAGANASSRDGATDKAPAEGKPEAEIDHAAAAAQVEADTGIKVTPAEPAPETSAEAQPGDADPA